MAYENCLPIDKLKDRRWSLSVDERGSEIVKDFVALSEGKRAPISRESMFIGMYYRSLAEGRPDLAKQIEDYLREQDPNSCRLLNAG